MQSKTETLLRRFESKGGKYKLEAYADCLEPFTYTLKHFTNNKECGRSVGIRNQANMLMQLEKQLEYYKLDKINLIRTF